MSRKNPKKIKRQTEQVAQEEEEGEKGFRDSWEFRSGKFALRIAAVLIFLGYLGMSGASSINWVHMKWVRSQSLEKLPEIADDYLNKVFKPEKLNKWVSLRRREETEDIIRLLMPYTGRLPTFTFFYYSVQLKELGKTDDALFWWQFSRYRARFDALRCGSVMAVENLGELLQYVPHPEFPADQLDDSKDVVESLLSVLDLDAHYPAENIPEELCTPLRAMEPGKFKSVQFDSWKKIRHTLRRMTEYRLEKLSDKFKVEPKVRYPSTVVITDPDKPLPPKELILGTPHARPGITSDNRVTVLAAGLGQLAIFLLFLAADRKKSAPDENPGENTGKESDKGGDGGGDS